MFTHNIYCFSSVIVLSHVFAYLLLCSFCPCQAQVLFLVILSSGVRPLYVHVYIPLEMKLVFPPLLDEIRVVYAVVTPQDST